MVKFMCFMVRIFLKRYVMRLIFILLRKDIVISFEVSVVCVMIFNSVFMEYLWFESDVIVRVIINVMVSVLIKIDKFKVNVSVILRMVV